MLSCFANSREILRIASFVYLLYFLLSMASFIHHILLYWYNSFERYLNRFLDTSDIQFIFLFSRFQIWQKYWYFSTWWWSMILIIGSALIFKTPYWENIPKLQMKLNESWNWLMQKYWLFMTDYQAIKLLCYLPCNLQIHTRGHTYTPK